MPTPKSIGRIHGASTVVLAALNHQATVAGAAGRLDDADIAHRTYLQLSGENARLLERLQALLAAGSLKPDLKDLNAIARDAERAAGKLSTLARVLNAASDMVGLVGRAITLIT